MPEKQLRCKALRKNLRNAEPSAGYHVRLGNQSIKRQELLHRRVAPDYSTGQLDAVKIESARLRNTDQ